MATDTLLLILVAHAIGGLGAGSTAPEQSVAVQAAPTSLRGRAVAARFSSINDGVRPSRQAALVSSASVSLDAAPDEEWPWIGRDREQTVHDASLPKPPPAARAAIPGYRPPAGVAPTYHDAQLRTSASVCPQVDCGQLCSDSPYAPPFAKSRDCVGTCHKLAEQCCTFCLYSSYSFALPGQDASAARRTCFDQCPRTIHVELWTTPAPPAPSPAPTPLQVVLPPQGLRPPAPVIRVVQPASGIVPIPAPAPAAVPAWAPARDPGAAKSVARTIADADSGVNITEPAPTLYPPFKQWNCSPCLGNDARDCQALYDECGVNCMVAFEDPIGQGRSHCLQQCAHQVCSAEIEDDKEERSAAPEPALIGSVTAPPLRDLSGLHSQASAIYSPQAQKAALALFPDLLGNGEANMGDHALRAALHATLV